MGMGAVGGGVALAEVGLVVFGAGFQVGRSSDARETLAQNCQVIGTLLVLVAVSFVVWAPFA